VNKTEEVKKILEQFRNLDWIDATSYQSGINSERKLAETTQRICKLFKPICPHLETTIIDDKQLCVDCGEEVIKEDDE